MTFDPNEKFFPPSIVSSSAQYMALDLGIPGFSYKDLYEPLKLQELNKHFFDETRKVNSDLVERFEAFAAVGAEVTGEIVVSNLLLEMAPYVGRFVARLFQVDAFRDRQMAIALRDRTIFDFKREFLSRRALKKHKSLESVLQVASAEELAKFGDWIERYNSSESSPEDAELHFARIALLLAGLEKNPEETTLDPIRQSVPASLRHHLSGNNSDLAKKLGAMLEAFAAWLYHDPHQRELTKEWVSYHLPQSLDYNHLVEVIRPESLLPEKFAGPEKEFRRRDGFALTDTRMTHRQVQSETDYCVFCHERARDSCSKGFVEKEGGYKKNPLGIPLEGCPLKEKISEMHVMLDAGDSISALALIMIDNPMCPGTGHRICNDCMKGCIYQKQTPVNIPQAETGALTDVLGMRWGFEIYSFLARWNPLNIKRPFALPYNGKNVLVVGMGPAGYTLAHYLLNEGFGIVGIDGLKIEPLSNEDTGYFDESGSWIAPRPLEQWSSLYKALDERTLDGFGGVAEYGITVRWDKNFLTTIYLTLARRMTLAIYGGVRFGGTLTIEDAFDRYKFDHIAIASGAGKPTIVKMKNNLIRGVRKASDFLMALQLTGAQKRDTMTNLQVQLPAVVIGGGLTAIDTATELMAYYPIQVEKYYKRYQTLMDAGVPVDERIGLDDKKVLATFIEHGKAIIGERERAKVAGELPSFIPLLRAWGGVTIAYRKSLQDSPAYRLNHEEVEKSLEEGIYYVENMSPIEVIPDENDAVQAVRFERQSAIEGKWRSTGELVELFAKTVCVAAGTSPNTIYEKERPGTFKLDDWKDFFRAYALDESDELVEDKTRPQFFTSYTSHGKFITYYGDNHPKYAGNVVKAMASAKDGYPEVVRAVFGKTERSIIDMNAWFAFKSEMDDQLIAKVVRVDRLTRTIVEIIVRAPAAAEHFYPGQFYRLQNFEKLAHRIDETVMTMEGLALTGAWVDKTKGLLSLIVLEMGSSSRLCAALRPGEPVIVMGPTGTPTTIPENETVLLAGGGLGNAVLFSIAKALKEKNNKVIYFAGYKFGEDLFKREEIEAYTDQVVFSTDAGLEISADRSQDAHIRANILEAMLAYEAETLGVPKLFPLATVSRLIAIGSDRMMAAVKMARRPGGKLYDLLPKDHIAIGSINSPMQCMMKEVCAQCLQRHLDPVTQKETGYVFSCFDQDQELDKVDFQHLNERLRANSLEEKLSLMWFEHLMQHEPMAIV
jgi:NADPH-dependent glutamate synthase beta subunit-like oxidoreductase/NAD(P)H-flavin reductase